MHALAYVLVPPHGDVEASVNASLEPHRETGESGWWDWWQIGGRFSGLLDGYDPESDPANVEACSLCGGRGRRPDADAFGAEWAERMGGCNGCMGKGVRAKWPTKWRRHDGDVAELGSVAVDISDSWAVVCGEACVVREWWDGEADKWVRMTDGDYAARVAAVVSAAPTSPRVVVVDLHH